MPNPNAKPKLKEDSRVQRLFTLGWVEIQTHDMGTVIINPQNIEMFSGGGGRPQITMRSGKTFQPTPTAENHIDELLGKFVMAKKG